MKKKLLIPLIAIVFAILVTTAIVTGCGKDKGNSGNSGNSSDTPTPPPANNFVVPDNAVSETKLTVYEGPKVMDTSSVVGVKVENTPLFVYDTRVNHERSFTYSEAKTFNQVVIFDFEGKVKVDVEVYGETKLSNVVVRPLEYEINVAVSGNKISFELEYPANYVVEYSTEKSAKASDNALHVFANPIETEKVDPNNLPANTVYVGPGVWMASALPVSSDDTNIYLAGGAVVYGQIRTANVKNLKVYGRGILCGELFTRTKASEFTLPIELQNCKNVTIKDIAILDPAGWAVTLYKCENVNIDNLKIITARANGDGISVQSCKNVTVKGGFVRTWDDSLVVKNVDNASTNGITFDGVTVWTDLAQSMEVGYETFGPAMNDINFKNITVLHNFHKAAMSIHNADNAKIDGVTYENITIEDAQMLGDNQNDGENDFLIDITIAYNTEWTQSGGARGSISNITFKNIKVLEMADTIKCRTFGEGTQSNVNNVKISNVTIKGKQIASLDELGLKPGVYTSNITLTKGLASGAVITLPYKCDVKGDNKVTTKIINNIEQDGLIVPPFAVLDNEPPYAGKKVDTSNVKLTATYGSGDRAAADWNVGTCEVTNGHEVTNLLDGNRSTTWVYDGWQGLDKEFAAINFEFPTATKIGNIRIFGTEGSNIMRYYSVAIFVKNSPEKAWQRIQAQDDIALSPQKSNYNDTLIRISEDGYYGIQLRFFRNNSLTHPSKIELGEIEFYPPSLTTNKSFKEVAEHEDVYDITNMIDGNTLTYFESKKGLFPASFAIDLGKNEMVKYINIHLPPLLTWENRTQEIEILGSLDGKNYTTVVVKQNYVFDSTKGNMVSIVLDAAVEMRYIKLVFTANSTGYGAQISELYVYGE